MKDKKYENEDKLLKCIMWYVECDKWTNPHEKLTLFALPSNNVLLFFWLQVFFSSYFFCLILAEKKHVFILHFD